MGRLVLAVSVALAASLAGATDASAKRKPRAAEVDYLELATVLVRDGRYDRAQNALSQVDTSREDLDRPRFHLVRGLVRLNLTLFAQAAEDFRASIAATTDRPVDPILYVYLAQALFHSQQLEPALEAFDRAGARADEIRGTFAMRAEANWKLKRYEAAWAVATDGLQRFPGYHELLRRKVFYAVDRGLYQVAAELGRRYLERAEVAPEDYLALGGALARSGRAREALEFLELARLRYPADPTVTRELARVYKALNRYRTAATLLEPLALSGGDDVLVEAAELYRQAGDHFHALGLNARVGDSAKRLRQRLGIQLELRRYELVALMEDDLRRVGLLEDENIRYAMAYAHFKTGRFDRADALLSGLRDSALFRQGTELRKAMADCRKDPWRC